MKFTKLRFICFLSLFLSMVTHAQEVTVKGKVTDESGLPMPGVTVKDSQSSITAGTDMDGNYQIKTSAKGTLSFSFISYKTTTEAVNGRTSINVVLSPEAQNLNEVVVVGYGTQKKSVVTASISSIKAKDIENLPITRIEQSLQGRAAGVMVSANAGQPGSASTVRIRGITTLNAGNDPLYVVDGVVLESSGIGYLNQSDIESIEVLKDAASAAIYGTRGASGVILITTKKGKAGKITATYNGFAGTSKPARKLDLLNATQYATLINEALAAAGEAPRYTNVSSLGKGTDWQSQIFNNSAQRVSHEVSLSGGNENSNFYLSYGLRDEEGIVSTDISNYTRKNFRLNSTHKFAKYFTFGENFGYSREKTVGIGNTNSEYGGPLASAINLDPVTPVVETNPTALSQGFYLDPNIVRNEAGEAYGISSYVGNEITNPAAYVKTRLGNYSWAENIVGNMFLEVEPIKGLKFKSNYTYKKATYGDYSFTPHFLLSAVQQTTFASLFKSSNVVEDYQIENTISYAKNIKDHNFTILLGQGAYEYGKGGGQGVTYNNQPTNDYREASFGWETASADKIGYAYTNVLHKLSSIFGRVNYDYKEKYLLTATIRRDGSSLFGSDHKYGNFPSVSVGWVPTKESFWKENNVLTSLKLRGSWGVTGNDAAIRPFAYAPIIQGGNNYPTGTSGGINVGYSPISVPNPGLSWEETTQTDIGLEFMLFRNLSVNMDYYTKKTTGILRTIVLPGYVGATNDPVGNVGAMKNSGFELELAYRKKIGDLNLNVSGNMATLKNEVTALSPGIRFEDGERVQGNGTITRVEVGHPYNAFYGYHTMGVFQNQDQINAYANAAGTPIQPNAVPGDFKWEDVNGDGKITEQDRKFIGNPFPDVTYGLTVNLAYKDFDLTIFGQGTAGNQIYQGLRRLDLGMAPNFQTAALGRWTGEGTSNSFPRVTSDDSNGNFTNASNFYLQDGDYFRIKQIQLGYSLPAAIIGKAGLQRARLFVTGENLFTFTKYTGYDPEIGGNVYGIDRGYYPQAKSLMFGVNLQF